MAARRSAGKRQGERARPAAEAAPSAADIDQRFEQFRAAQSELLQRWGFAQGLGEQSFLDLATGLPLRRMDRALGYKSILSVADYRQRAQRNSLARRLLHLFPRAAWAGQVELVETPDVDVLTPFEREVADLFARLDAWDRLRRVDTLSQLGEYAVLLIGAPGSPETELPKNLGPKGAGVLYLAPYAQDCAAIKELEKDTESPRYCKPKFYELSTAVPAIGAGGGLDVKPITVHWTRVVHVAGGLLESDIYGEPALRAVWNLLDDLTKVVGGGAEAAWMKANPGFWAKVDSKVPLGVEAQAAFDDAMEEYVHDVRRVVQTPDTVALESFSTNVSNFGPNAEAVEDLIAAGRGVPKRIMMGSERGDLASSQDDAEFNDKVSDHRKDVSEPTLRALVDRLIKHGAVAAPKQPYEVRWPEVEELSESEKADQTKTLAEANAAQAQAGLPPVITSDEIRDRVWRYDPLPPVQPVDKPATPPVETPKEARAAAYKFIDGPAPEEPAWRAVHRAADAHVARLARAVREAWAAGGAAVDVAALERALAAGRHDEAAHLALAGSHEASRALGAILPGRLLAVVVSGGRAAQRVRVAKKRARRPRDYKMEDGRAAAPATSAITIRFDAENPRSTMWALNRSSQLVTEVDASTRAAIAAEIARGVSEGIAPRRLAGEIAAWVGLRADQVAAVRGLEDRLRAAGASDQEIEDESDRYADQLLGQRAELIARTETIAAASEGQRELWREATEAGELPRDAQRVWIDSADGDVCPDCAELDGAVADLDGNYPGDGGDGPPLHPACLTDDALVAPCGGITAQTERRYDGDLLIVRTASGKKLSVTPNHPILTPGGWVPARALHVGDHVVGSRARDWVVARRSSDHQDVPARFHEIADAARRSREMSTSEVPLSAEDFHGDGRYSEVAVVRTDRFLKRHGYAASAQQAGQLQLVRGSSELPYFARRGDFASVSERVLRAARRLVRLGDLATALRCGHARPLQQLGFALAAAGDAGFVQSLLDNSPADAVLLGDRVLRLAAAVERGDLFGRHVLAVRELAPRNASPSKRPVDHDLRDSVSPHELIAGFAGEVAADEIVAVDVVQFSGHVYNLQTGTGAYWAEGILTHNCRCAEGIATEEDLARAAERINAAVDKLLAEAS